MEVILYITFAYIGILFLWFVVCLLAFVTSVVLKRAFLINSLANIAGTVYGVLQVIIYLYLFFIMITNGFLWFLFMLIIGLTLFNVIFNLLQLPFALIPAFFVVKIEEMDFDDKVTTAEILDDKGKVVGVIEGDSTINRRLAKYFLGTYFLYLASFIFPAEREGLSVFSFIIKPFTGIVFSTIFLGLIYSLFRKIKYNF